MDETLWYKDAVIYEVRVRSFADSNGDGIGDFRGLTERLDYFVDLGVTALWLLPFYPSPLRDDGYDISDYLNIHPDLGTIQDFKVFLKEAKKRGLRVITELVINHTSDQHPWFKKSRQNPPDKKFKDFYVWSDNAKEYRKARIIFKDYEPSNWTFDPVAKKHFWHRFFSHQPDLNFDNPAVHKAVFSVMDFWMGMGVDGVRLDAIPYLYEREGTDCENLPETHLFLKKLRKQVDKKFKDKMFLAEANQWPEDAVAYFGQGDECHMSFHFPIMPRMFMSIHMEDRFPIIDILDQTPDIPENCQWALFLRNHDELTLEMVTDEERDYMNNVYASDKQARINLGIRRRLAPLLGNNRRKIELMNGLLFSLPGTPVIYYGDEIGMGDNFYLGDRNGVRTPMQWSGDKNAGFSRANPQKLYLPVVIDPEYHYETVNVETQQGNPHSLYRWMKRLIGLRKNHPAFGRGSIRFLLADNPKVLAFIREFEGETILVVANLSRFVQFAELDLSEFKGRMPVELFGQIPFPRVGELPYFLTLGPHGFYWFVLEKEEILSAPKAKGRGAGHPQTFQRWENVFHGKTRDQVENLLPSFLVRQRWFSAKARRPVKTRILDTVRFNDGKPSFVIAVVEVEFDEGTPATFTVPMAFAEGERRFQIEEGFGAHVICPLTISDKKGETEGILYDAAIEPGFSKLVLQTMVKKKKFKGETGEVSVSTTRAFNKWKNSPLKDYDISGVKAEQSNSSIAFDQDFILKFYRKFEEGLNPDWEVGLFLTEKAKFAGTPAVLGALEYRVPGREEAATLGVLTEFVPNEGDAWRFTLDNLERYYEVTMSRTSEGVTPPVRQEGLLELSKMDVDPLASELIGPFLESARLLGRKTAELHKALSIRTDDDHFTGEEFSPFKRRSVFQTFRDQLNKVFKQLKKKSSSLPKGAQEPAKKLLKNESKIFKCFELIKRAELESLQTRAHGDFHLGQILFTGKDFVIIDFEGEPARTMIERRRKRSPLRDVAGLIRSFHYATQMGIKDLEKKGLLDPASEEAQLAWGAFWFQWVSAAFLRAYLDEVKDGAFGSPGEEEIKLLLNLFLLDKAVYELGYELNNRPEWISIPIEGMFQVLREIDKE